MLAALMQRVLVEPVGSGGLALMPRTGLAQRCNGGKKRAFIKGPNGGQICGFKGLSQTARRRDMTLRHICSALARRQGTRAPGGSDGTRTRGLRRDRPANSIRKLITFPTFCSPEPREIVGAVGTHARVGRPRRSQRPFRSEPESKWISGSAPSHTETGESSRCIAAPGHAMVAASSRWDCGRENGSKE